MSASWSSASAISLTSSSVTLRPPRTLGRRRPVGFVARAPPARRAWAGAPAERSSTGRAPLGVTILAVAASHDLVKVTLELQEAAVGVPLAQWPPPLRCSPGRITGRLALLGRDFRLILGESDLGVRRIGLTFCGEL